MKISESIGRIRHAVAGALSDYARARSEELLVGQFMDAEGAAHPQQGVYGMSAWCTLLCGLERNLAVGELKEKALRMRDSCAVTLSDWVMEGENSNPGNDTDAFELKYVIPKISAAYEALRNSDQRPVEAAHLKSRLLGGHPLSVHGWGYTTVSSSIHPISTCIVVRALLDDRVISFDLKSTLDWLTNVAELEPDGYVKLYILNTIVLGFRSTHIEEPCPRIILSKIKKLLAYLFRASAKSPFHPTSPINIDFYDAYRTRNFRLQPDAIAVESFYLLSSIDLVYLKAYPGRAVFSKICKTMEKYPLSVDTYGSRLSFSTCLDLYKCMNLIHAKNERSVTRFVAWLKCFSVFTEVNRNVWVVAVEVAIALVIWGLWYTSLATFAGDSLKLASSAIAGALFRDVFEIVRRVVEFQNKGHA
jgi:hypothetical protein